MYQLKMIEDPTYQKKWLFVDDGEKRPHYQGVISWSLLCYPNNKPRFSSDLERKEILMKLADRRAELGKADRDIVRSLNIEEYVALNQILRHLHVKFNKKKSQLIWET